MQYEVRGAQYRPCTITSAKRNVCASYFVCKVGARMAAGGNKSAWGHSEGAQVLHVLYA